MDEKKAAFGPAWRGWDRYQRFAQSVTSDFRYIRNEADEKFLADVRANCVNRKVMIPGGTLFWRARLGCDYEIRVDKVDEELTVQFEDERPYAQDGMKPSPNWQTEGRANPRGIPYLYLATNCDTALAEVRPWIDSKISVAQFEVLRDLNVIDCSKHHSRDSLLKLLDKSCTYEEGVWMAIDQAFARPVDRGDEIKQYIPTQIIAELFNSEGFDGIAYKSLLSNDGFNIALFNLDDAKVVSCGLYKATSLKFRFQPEGKEYFVKSP